MNYSKSNNYDKNINVRIDSTTYDILKDMSDKYNVTLSKMVRNIMLQYSSRYVQQ